MEKYVTVVVDHESVPIYTKLKRAMDVNPNIQYSKQSRVPCELGPFSVFP
jgi:hypothetical protein